MEPVDPRIAIRLFKLRVGVSEGFVQIILAAKIFCREPEAANQELHQILFPEV
jgi:hypothetical protein